MRIPEPTKTFFAILETFDGFTKQVTLTEEQFYSGRVYVPKKPKLVASSREQLGTFIAQPAERYEFFLDPSTITRYWSGQGDKPSLLTKAVFKEV